MAVQTPEKNQRAEYVFRSPVLCGKNDLYCLVLDFRVFTSVSIGDPSLKHPYFALQKEMLADIQSKLSKHVNRTGVVNL